jgi:hypothetical protein
VPINHSSLVARVRLEAPTTRRTFSFLFFEQQQAERRTRGKIETCISTRVVLVRNAVSVGRPIDDDRHSLTNRTIWGALARPAAIPLIHTS